RNKKTLGFIYVACFLGILFDILILNIDGSLGNFFKITPVIIFILVFLVYRGLPVFNYDSDGEVLNFTASEPHLRWMGKWTARHFEFPKRKLAGFSLRSYPFRRVLTVTIQSKESGLRKQKIKVSYLSSKEVRDLKRSLSGVLEKNKTD
ncbi:MAG: hypothetical protein ACPF9D_08395, partial [Owenweeksia sp.]